MRYNTQNIYTTHKMYFIFYLVVLLVVLLLCCLLVCAFYSFLLFYCSYLCAFWCVRLCVCLCVCWFVCIQRWQIYALRVNQTNNNNTARVKQENYDELSKINYLFCVCLYIVHVYIIREQTFCLVLFRFNATYRPRI